MSAHKSIGEKGGWVVDMLAAIDPRFWSRQFGLAPRDCLTVAEASEFSAVLVRGWSLAALRQADADTEPDAMAWPYALAAWWIEANVVQREAVPDAVFDLLGTRFHDDSDGASSALLDAFSKSWLEEGDVLQQLHRLLGKTEETWTPALTLRFLRLLEASLPGMLRPGQPWSARLLLPAFAKVADPATAAALEAQWRAAVGTSADWRAPIDNFFDLVRLRHEMTLSFQEPA
jgi:hypothetical protein